jgi:two-component system osmolarity sensor histidine kinase EnvZ
MPQQQVALSLFWRTFFLLALLLGGGVFAWIQTFRSLEFEPRAVQAAQQIASLVNLSRTALQYADGINRVTVVKAMTDQESVRILPREPLDKWEPFEVDRFSRRIGAELKNRLGPDTMVASSVNSAPGLWVGFSIDKDPYWLQVDPQRVQLVAGSTWFVSVSIALLATIFGSAAIARLINQPLKDLSFAASRIRDGEFESQLDENTITNEIREVNMGFNRMARELAKVEEDRAVMLAGISHDLRTPLARLRLEAEMSVQDEEAKRNIALDIDQLDAIIDKFMDYARPSEVKLVPVHLSSIVDREMAAFRDP